VLNVLLAFVFAFLRVAFVLTGFVQDSAKDTRNLAPILAFLGRPAFLITIGLLTFILTSVSRYRTIIFTICRVAFLVTIFDLTEEVAQRKRDALEMITIMTGRRRTSSHGRFGQADQGPYCESKKESEGGLPRVNRHRHFPPGDGKTHGKKHTVEKLPVGNAFRLGFFSLAT
jgi:hypothetical protein